jgi:hypothetical protein
MVYCFDIEVVVDIVFDIVGIGSNFDSSFGCHRVGIGRMILVGFCVILVSILLIFLCIRRGLFILVGMI